MSKFGERGMEEVDCKCNQTDFSDLLGIEIGLYVKLLRSGRPAFHFCRMN